MLLLLLAVFVPFLVEKSSVYGQQNTTTTTTTTTTMIESKIPYYVFPAEIEGIEEEILKIPHDAYSVQTIFAKKGDNITIKFYNTEAEDDIPLL